MQNRPPVNWCCSDAGNAALRVSLELILQPSRAAVVLLSGNRLMLPSASQVGPELTFNPANSG